MHSRLWHLKAQQASHGFRDLFLNCKDVPQFAAEGLRPQMMAGFRVDRLGSDPQLHPRFPDASLDHETGAETLAYFPDVNRHTFELESRRPRNYVQSRNPRECVDDFLTDPVAKIVLLRLRTHVYKRQHGNRYTASLDAGADFFPVFLWPSFQPAEDRHITARPQSDQDGIARTGPFLVICLQLGSEAASLDPYNRIDVRIIIGRAVEDLHGDRELLEAVEISIDGPIHNMGQKPGEPG